MAQHQPIRRTPPSSGAEIPDKLYFRIGEVSKLCDLPAYVLRFWESEFPSSSPTKAAPASGSIAAAMSRWSSVSSLLYDEGYTIPGARQVFKAELHHKEPQLALDIDEAAHPAPSKQLRKLQKELRDIHAILSRPVARAAVHPIRAPRNSHAPRPSAPKLFDLSSISPR